MNSSLLVNVLRIKLAMSLQSYFRTAVVGYTLRKPVRKQINWRLIINCIDKFSSFSWETVFTSSDQLTN